MKRLQRMVSKGLVRGVHPKGATPDTNFCVPCLEGKMSALPFHSAERRAVSPGDRLHMDLMGPMEVTSIHRNRYVLTILDEASRYAWVFFLREKSDTEATVQNFFAYFKLQYGTDVRALRTDNGGEFLSGAFSQWLESHGVEHQLTIPGTPQQNGVAERYNRTLQERGRCMMFEAGLPPKFWEHAFAYACWCGNRLPTSANKGDVTPFTALFGREPNLSMARVFGCQAYVLTDPTKRSGKLDKRALLAIFVGIPSRTKAWEFYIPSTKTIGVLSRNAVFREHLLYKDLATKPQVIPPDESEAYVQDSWEVPDFPPLRLPPAQPQIVPRGPEPPRDSVGVGLDHPNPMDPGVQGEGEPDQLTQSEAHGGDLNLAAPAPVEEPLPSVPHQEEFSLGGDLGGGEGPAPVHTAQEDPSPNNSLLALEEALFPQVVETVSEDNPPLSERPVRDRRQPIRLEPTIRGQRHLDVRGTEVLVPQAPPPVPTLVESAPVLRGPDGDSAKVKPLAEFYANLARSVGMGVPPTEEVKVPKGYKTACSSPQSAEWREAMQVEFDRLQEMGTYDLVEPPPGANILRSHWVYALKRKPDNTIDRYKARLVIDGRYQQKGIDFDETFANTAGKATIRLFMALCAVNGLQMAQLDVSTAFLYADVDKEIYMHQPLGFDDGSGRVLKLRRGLYGLKQAPRLWHEKLDSVLRKLGFKPSELDPVLFYAVVDGQVVWLLAFVDDILLAAKDQEILDRMKARLMSEFKMTDMGLPQRYVGLEIQRDMSTGELWLHQETAIHDLGQRWGITDDPPIAQPLRPGFKVLHPWETVDGGEDNSDLLPEKVRPDPPLLPAEAKNFRQMVGSLNYLAHSTRPDVAYAVSQLSRVMMHPRGRHLAAARQCIAYLLCTARWGLHFSASAGPQLECYVDANHGGSPDHKSMTGIILLVAGGPVWWTARKQDRITTSTCDSESLAIQTATQNVEMLRDLLDELGHPQAGPTPVLNDNSAAVGLAVDARAHKKSVQLTRQMAYVRERVERGLIRPLHVSTTDQAADFLTKALPVPAFDRCRWLSGMEPVPTQRDPSCGARGSVGTSGAP
jgi:hypothetical protein